MAEGTSSIVDSTGLTVKEYLARIDAKVDKIDEKLDGKADVGIVASIEGRVRTLEVGVSQATSIAAEVNQLKVEHKVALEHLYNDINWLKKKVWIAAGAASTIGVLWGFIHANIIRLG